MSTVNMEAQKVSFTQEQYDAFEKLRSQYQIEKVFLDRLIAGNFEGYLAPFKDLDLHTLLKAYYHGYKLELTPLEKLDLELDLVIYKKEASHPDVRSEWELKCYQMGLETARGYMVEDEPASEPVQSAPPLHAINTENTIHGSFRNHRHVYDADLIAVNMKNGTYDIIKNTHSKDNGVVLGSIFGQILYQSQFPIVLSISNLKTDNKGRAIFK